MRRTRTLALLTLSLLATSAAAEPCQLLTGLSTSAELAPQAAREANRRLGWSLQAIEHLREELRHGDFSKSQRSGSGRNDVVRMLVLTGAQPWLDVKRAACRCDERPAVCTSLEADAERLRAALPRTSIRRPIDIDRLTKGR